VNKNSTVIAIAGASASGKSLMVDTIYKELLPQLGDSGITILKEDAYYKSQDHLCLDERKKTNYDHPDAFDHELLVKHIVELSAGKSIKSPIYCYKTHTRATDIVDVNPAKVIIVEGILLFTQAMLLDCFDIKVYMDTPLDVCLSRRIKRDMTERDRTIDSIVNQYSDTVRPMYFKFIKPTKELADISVSRGGENRIAIDLLKTKIKQLAISI
jgi:uridine kinase